MRDERQSYAITITDKIPIVTGASTGLGYELAKCCANAGYDLLIAADQGPLDAVADELRSAGIEVQTVMTDLATVNGVDQLWAAVGSRPVDALLANAAHGLGHAFLEQDFSDVQHVINTNITGTIYLIQKSRQPNAGAPREADSYYWLYRGIYARIVFRRLQRHQSFHRFFFHSHWGTS